MPRSQDPLKIKNCYIPLELHILRLLRFLKTRLRLLEIWLTRSTGVKTQYDTSKLHYDPLRLYYAVFRLRQIELGP